MFLKFLFISYLLFVPAIQVCSFQGWSVMDFSGSVISYSMSKDLFVNGCYKEKEYKEKNFLPGWKTLVKRGLLNDKLIFRMVGSDFTIYNPLTDLRYQINHNKKYYVTSWDGQQCKESRDINMYAFLKHQEAVLMSTWQDGLK